MLAKWLSTFTPMIMSGTIRMEKIEERKDFFQMKTGNEQNNDNTNLNDAGVMHFEETSDKDGSGVLAEIVDHLLLHNGLTPDDTDAIISGDNKSTNHNVNGITESDLSTSVVMPFFEDNGILGRPFVPMWSGKPLAELWQMSTKELQRIKGTDTAIIAKEGKVQFSISKYDDMQSALSLSAKKLLFAGIIFLSENNHFRGNLKNVNPTVIIPLIEYANSTNNNLIPRRMSTKEDQDKENKLVKNRIRQFRKKLRDDLEGLRNLGWAGAIEKGYNKGDYVGLRYISSYRVGKDTITINFDIDFARMLSREYVIQGATALLRLNSNNAFSLGLKAAIHNSNDNNYAVGTDCTLSVNTLLKALPDIPSMQELQNRGQRNWKAKIKKVLEKEMDKLVNVKYWKNWKYRNPRTGLSYTAKETQSLKWEQYRMLMVDWIMESTPPGQIERRAKKAAQKAEIVLAKEAIKATPGRKQKQAVS